jgi:acyl carrier protein
MNETTVLSVRDDIRAFIKPKLRGTDVPDDCDIFSLGFVNSLFAMELVMFVEKLTSARIPNHEVRLDNFRTVDAMTALVERMTSAETVEAGQP